MQKQMIGDVVVVVIDEIGEVTFLASRELPGIVGISKKETLTRVLAAIGECLHVVASALPVSAAQFEALKAHELLMQQFGPILERLTEQAEFTDSLL